MKRTKEMLGFQLTWKYCGVWLALMCTIGDSFCRRHLLPPPCRRHRRHPPPPRFGPVPSHALMNLSNALSDLGIIL